MNEIAKSSTSVDIERTPHIIATEIYSIKGQARSVILLSSVEIGKRLIEAKSMLSHGEWGDWLKSSVEYSQSTAENLMQIYREYGSEDSKFPSAIGNMSYTKAVSLLGISSEDREEFVKVNDVEAMSTRELQKAIKERDNALKTLEDARKISIKSSEDAKNMFDGKMKAESDLRTTRDVLKDAQKDYKALQVVLQKEKNNAKGTIEHLEKSIVSTKKLLIEAKVSENPEEVERLKASLQEHQNDLDASAQRIDELEEKLKSKPIDITETVIEKIPIEVEKELHELRQKDRQNNDQSVVKFSVYFDELVKNFQNLLGALEIIENVEVHEKYKNAVNGLINKMSERL